MRRWNSKQLCVPASILLPVMAVAFFSVGVAEAFGEYEVAKIVAPDGATTGWMGFGCSVAFSGNVAVIGADESAYVYRYDGSNWNQEARLVAADGAPADYFGLVVSISGETIVVGARRRDESGSDSGAAYVFRYDGSHWSQEAKLVPSDGVAYDGFGSAVSLSGDRVLIGAGYANGGGGACSGVAYVFRRDSAAPGNWIQEAKLVAADGAADDFLGLDVALAGDIAVIAAWNDGNTGPGYLNGRGSAYVFRRNDGGTPDNPGDDTWSQEAKLVAADGAAGYCFGSSVAVSGNTILVGASNDGGTCSFCWDGRGAAYVFRYVGSSWSQTAKLLASDAETSAHFGEVAIEDNVAVIGAYGDDRNGAYTGAAYWFKYDGTIWRQAAKFIASDGSEMDSLGTSVAIHGGTALIPAYRDDDKGSVYVFRPAAHDCNNNGTPDIDDIGAGTSEDCNHNDIPDECEPPTDCNINGIQDICEVAHGGTGADCNGNGVPDDCDLAAGASQDCDRNLVPDECELGAGVVFRSTQLTPFGYEVPQHYVVLSPPPTGSDVKITLTVRGDFGNNEQNCLNEYFDVDINGMNLVRVFNYTGGHDCPSSPDVYAFTVPADLYNTAVATGSVSLNMVPNFRVGAYECPISPSYVSVVIEYQVMPDCNGNGVPDRCDIQDGTSGDCDNNGIPDECEDCNGNQVADACDIAAGTSRDCNANSIADECELTGRDCNANGILDSCDINGGTSHDCNANRIPDECELAGGDYLLVRTASVPAGHSPHSVAVGDFNEDGHLDLAVSNEQADQVSVLLGDGAGRFAPLTSFAGGSHGMAIAKGDFDGDGHLDLAVLNELYDNVAILRGSGLGTFALSGFYPVGDKPISLAVGDFNEDGRADLAVASYDSGQVHVLISNDQGGFDTSALVSCYQAQAILVGDFNEDRHLDVAVAASAGIRVSSGDGSGGFGVGAWYSSGFSIRSIVAADLDNDGHLDLIATSGNTREIQVLEGRGAEGFGGFSGTNVAIAPQSIVAADLNQDGQTDLVVADYNAHLVGVFRRDAYGVLGLVGTFYAGQYPRALAVGDVNEDGRPDVVAVNMQESRVSILLEGVVKADCNANLVLDECDIAGGTSRDCESNGVPDECELANQLDEDDDGVRDACDQCPHTLPGLTVDVDGCSPAVPGDMDRDGDVDLADLGLFQLCLSGSRVPQTASACQRAKLDGDDFVDANDLVIFRNCMSGSRIPADVGCAN